MLDVIIAKEPTEVVKCVYFCRKKTVERLSIDTLSDLIITDYILTDTCFHGHNYSRSAVSGKFFIFRTVKTNFHLNE